MTNPTGGVDAADELRTPSSDLSNDKQTIVRTNRIMSSNIDYVADHICRIEGIHAGHPNRILNSKWRIASNIDLFPYGELADDGTLTPHQISEIDAYISKFKATPVGQKAIAQYQRRAS